MDQFFMESRKVFHNNIEYVKYIQHRLWESSSFLFHFKNIISSWSFNLFWTSDMNSLIYVKSRWILMNSNVFTFTLNCLKQKKKTSCNNILIHLILSKCSFCVFALALYHCTHYVCRISFLSIRWNNEMGCLYCIRTKYSFIISRFLQEINMFVFSNFISF